MVESGGAGESLAALRLKDERVERKKDLRLEDAVEETGVAGTGLPVLRTSELLREGPLIPRACPPLGP